MWANEKAKATPSGGWVSANKGLDVANLASPIDKLSVEILQDPDAVFRFDGSDLMPGAVGAGSFWKEMTAWITGAEHAGHPRQHRERPGRVLARRRSLTGGRAAARAGPCRGSSARTAAAGRCVHPVAEPPLSRPSHRECALSTGEKFVQMFIAIALFFGVVARDPAADPAAPVAARASAIQSAAFVLPAVAADRDRPALPRDRHDLPVVHGRRRRPTFVGLDNYQTIFTDTEQLRVLRNTAALGGPGARSLATAIGLIYAVLVDRARFEKFAKALIFLPMAISLVGASIIWKFVYDYQDQRERPDRPANADPQVGSASTPTSSCSTSRGTPSS